MDVSSKIKLLRMSFLYDVIYSIEHVCIMYSTCFTFYSTLIRSAGLGA